MRNVWKARVAPLLGVIALVAVAALFTTACGEEPVDVDAPPGTVKITYTEFGPFEGADLKAVYTPGEGDPLTVADLGFLWYKEDASGKFNIGGEFDDHITTSEVSPDTITFTPNTIGKYKVIAVNIKAVTEAGGPDKVAKLGYVDSPVFAVKAAGTEEARIFGSWTSGSFQPAGTPAGTSATETLIINYIEFKLDSTYSNEKIYWDIEKWTELTTIPNTAPAGFTVGYKLNVKMTENNGYTPFKSFNVFYNPTTKTSIWRTNEGGANVRQYTKD